MRGILKPVLVACLVAFGLAGCLSPGQEEAIRVQREINRAVATSDDCLAPIREKPEYQPLFRRLAIEPSVPPPAPTAEQMADATLADRDSVRLMVALHGDLGQCRGALIESIARIAPELAGTAVDVWLRGDRLVLSLMRREVTWGEANRQIGALQQDYYRRLAEVTAATRQRMAEVAAGAMAAESPEVPPSVRRFPADLTEIHRQMEAVYAGLPG